jgi:hypothetical protein
MSIDQGHHDHHHHHHHAHNAFKRKLSIQERRNKLRPQILNLDSDEQSKFKRISIEAIDFDWIFTGENA